jgi:hypothetical protein
MPPPIRPSRPTPSTQVPPERGRPGLPLWQQLWHRGERARRARSGGALGVRAAWANQVACFAGAAHLCPAPKTPCPHTRCGPTPRRPAGPLPSTRASPAPLASRCRSRRTTRGSWRSARCGAGRLASEREKRGGRKREQGSEVAALCQGAARARETLLDCQLPTPAPAPWMHALTHRRAARLLLGRFAMEQGLQRRLRVDPEDAVGKLPRAGPAAARRPQLLIHAVGPPHDAAGHRVHAAQQARDASTPARPRRQRRGGAPPANLAAQASTGWAVAAVAGRAKRASCAPAS